MSATSGGLSRPCQYNGHTVCPGGYLRPIPGVLPGITTAHHPRPAPGDALHYDAVRCLCRCHLRPGLAREPKALEP